MTIYSLDVLLFLFGTSWGLLNFFFLSVNLFLKYLIVLDLQCCAWAFSSCGERASHRDDFAFCGGWTLGPQASVAVVHGLSRSTACRILSGRGSDLCFLH